MPPRGRAPPCRRPSGGQRVCTHARGDAPGLHCPVWPHVICPRRRKKKVEWTSPAGRPGSSPARRLLPSGRLGRLARRRRASLAASWRARARPRTARDCQLFDAAEEQRLG